VKEKFSAANTNVHEDLDAEAQISPSDKRR
jgi:hypothetical protein